MIALATRIFPPEAGEAELRLQWTVGAKPAVSRAVLLRMPVNDPLAADHLARLIEMTPARRNGLASIWADAQLAADATLIGMAIGVRVVLVPERGRWFADLLLIRGRKRLRFGRGSLKPETALAACRRRWTNSLDSTARRPARLAGRRTT